MSHVILSLVTSALQLGLKLLKLYNSQISKHIRLIEEDTQSERKKSRDTSHTDTTDL